MLPRVPTPLSRSLLTLFLLSAIATIPSGAGSRTLAAPFQEEPGCNLVVSSITGAVAVFTVTGDGTTALSVASATGHGITAVAVGTTTNATVSASPAPPTTGTNPITITATPIDPNQPASATVSVTDGRGSVIDRRTIVIDFVLDCPSSQVEGCTYTVGYWKNHPEAWPVSDLTLGTVNYTQSDLLSILRKSVRGNGLVALAHQLIAAKLNIANGASAPASVLADIAAADALIGALVVPPVGGGYLSPASTAGLVANLDAYNNGLALEGPPHCE